MFYALALSLLTSLSSQQPVVPENLYETCFQKLDRGDANCKKPNNTIRFYFDEELETCFTYLYEGCGGSRNTFYTEVECRTTCISEDKFICHGNSAPTGACTENDDSCPLFSRCVLGGLGIGLCCHNANEDEWLKDTNPTCEVGDVLLREAFHRIIVWIGKSCSHRFCPNGYDCFEGKQVAHCCGPIPDFKETFFNPTGGKSTKGGKRGHDSTSPVNYGSVGDLPPPLARTREHAAANDQLNDYRRR